MTTYLPSGTEFRINTVSAGDQNNPRVAALSDGRYVVVWGTTDPAQDGSQGAIKGQIFNADGTNSGVELLVNTDATEDQSDPQVVALDNATFAVFWTSQDPAADTSEWAIQGQILDGAGNKIGPEFTVNNEATGRQFDAKATRLADGNMVVTWTTNDPLQDTSDEAVKALILAPNGVKLSGEILVNTQSALGQSFAAPIGLTDGNFVVVWATRDPAQDGSGQAVRAQLFTAAGAKIGAEFTVNTETVDDQTTPAGAALTNGGYVLVWATVDATQDGSGTALKGQVFAADGTKQGAEFLVNTQSPEDQLFQDVLPLPNGTFVVTWTTRDPAQDGSGSAVKAQTFAADGTKLGGKFLVNMAATSSQGASSVARLTNGDLVFVWGTGDTSQDGSGNAVKAQAYTRDVNTAPTGATLSSATVDENAALGTVIGKLSAVDADPFDSHDFLLLNGPGSSIQLVEDQLVVGAGAVIDFEAAPEIIVVVRTIDDRGLGVNTSLTITVNDLFEQIDGTPGPDSLEGDAGDNLIEALAGNDFVSARAGQDTIVGEVGDDTIFAGADDDRVHAGNGNDSVVGSTGSDTLHGDNEEDFVDGGAGADTVTGGRGNDTLWGGGSGDELWGWLGLDSILGDAGDDFMVGETDSDTLDGGSGADTGYGGQGWDLLIGGDGADSLIGDTENDTLLGGDGDDTLEGGFDDDVLFGEFDNDELWGWLGNDILEGGRGDDRLFGEEGEDVVSGGEDNDVLVGGSGNDTLWGFTGNDTLDGGTGDDELRAEAGADQFDFMDGFGSDTLFGYEDGIDKINFGGVSTVGSFATLRRAGWPRLGRMC